jgi:hypothetical protein
MKIIKFIYTNTFNKLHKIQIANFKSIYRLQPMLAKGYRHAAGNFVPSNNKPLLREPNALILPDFLMIFPLTVWVIRLRLKIIKNSVRISTLGTLATIQLLFLGLSILRGHNSKF